jgi:putative hydrolase of HD superfamily
MTQNRTLLNIADTVRFVIESDKLKGVLRKVRPVAENRFENTAEHSWQIALFALSLARTLTADFDMERVISMLLVHDLGEIDAGDKFVFAQEGWGERKTAEMRGVYRVTSLAPDDTAELLMELWKEFDEGITREARFARAIDRSMPVLLNIQNAGGSWLENGVSFERVVGRVGPEIEAGCPDLWAYVKLQLEEARSKGYFAPGT